MKYTRILLLVLFCQGITLGGFAQEAKEVLFVGNSYTYFWNLHLQVRALAQEKKAYQLITSESTAGGVNLGQHWRGEKGLTTRLMIANGDYDAIIFQDHSTRAIDAPDSLLYYGTLFAQAARETGAEVFYYLTWARQWDPYMQQPIVDAYQKVAAQNNARIIPVGPAWERALQMRPDLKLYDADGSHPSPVGTYLSACVVYGVLTGDSPVGLSERVALEDKDGLGYLFLNRMKVEDALFCQKVAEEILEKYRP